MHLRPLPTPDDDAPGLPWDGITHPTGAGGRGRFLTDVIIDLGFVQRDRVEDAIAAARQAQTTPESVLVERGELSAQTLSRAVAERHGLDHLDLTAYAVDMAAANLVTPGWVRRHNALPVGYAGERTLLVAMADPANVRAVDDLAVMTGHEIRAAVAAAEDIAGLVNRLTQLGDAV
ncbi:MAG: type pilus assembly protein PilB, partial [Solirubrobacteraceae bacterium]|nr:type pilus assembly protein PilB [Solirubrobacteraceae bacterium]